MVWKLFLIFSLFSFNALAQVSSFTREKLPLFEIGAGSVWANLPDYPASDRNRNFFMPFPAAVYRGDNLRADEDGGLRSRFFNSSHFEINMSFGGSLPANAKDNPDRQGMDNLPLILEFGPGLIIHLIEKKQFQRQKLGLNIPVRHALRTEWIKFKGQGMVFNPLLYYIHDGFILDKLILFSAIDWRWASSTYHRLFYQVEPEFATVNRATYYAGSGEVGTNYTLGLTYVFNSRWSFFGAFSRSDFSNNANTDSPLFKRQYASSIAFGFVWWFYQSELKGYR